MGKVTVYYLDTITDKSGHQMVGFAVSVCLTPAPPAPAPLPIPYPTMGNVSEGLTDPCMRTKIEGNPILTLGGCMKVCHGNEAGVMREVVSLNTAGPCFPWLGAPTVYIELGMAGITFALGQMNKGLTFGLGANASGAGGAGGGGGGPGGPGAGAPGAGGPEGPGNGGGGGGGTNEGANPPDGAAPPDAEGQAKAGHPVDVITGTMYTTPAVDIDLRGPLPLQWVRQYRSSAVRRQCGIGFGWTHPFAWRAEVGSTTITVFDSEGSPIVFPRLEDGEIAYAPFGRSLERRGTDVVLATRDRVERILRRGAHGHYHLEQVRDRSGNTTTLAWNGGDLVGVTDCVGRRIERECIGNTIAWRVIVTDADGKEHRRLAVAYDIDARGDLVRAVDAGGVATEYRYDEAHFLIEERLPDGLIYHFRYEDGPDGKRRCVETWGELSGRDIVAELAGVPAGSTGAKGIFHMRLSYGPRPFETTVTDATGGIHRYRGNALGLVEEYTDPLGRATRLSYDARGHITSVRDPMGYVEQSRFDSMGRLLTTNDPLGRLTRIRRDEGGHAIELADPGGGRWTMQHDGAGRIVRRTDPSGGVTTCAYDDRGLAVKTAGPGGVEQTSYDAHGNLIERIDVRGARWRYTWDLLGLPVRLSTPTGAVYELKYDSRGDIVATDGPCGRRMERAFDARRRVTVERHPGGGITTYRWLGDALVASVSPDGAELRRGYDAMLRPIWLENAAGERYTFDHDAAGQLVRERTFAGIELRYEYDAAGRCIKKIGPDGRAVRVTLNAGGQVVRREHDGGGAVELDYDARGFLTRAANGPVQVELTRDLTGRVVREIQRLGGWQFTVDHEHDTLGYEVGTRYGTGWYVSRRRGPRGVLTQLSVHAADGAVEEALAFEYGEQEIVHRLKRRDGLATVRDKLGRPSRIRVLGADGSPVRERLYTWAQQPGVARIDDSARGTRTYELDPIGQPVRVSGLGVDEQYTYSSQGTPMATREGVCRIGAGGRKLATERATFTWDTRGRLVQRKAGNPLQSWTYAYDADNRLVEACRGDGFSIRYLYDAFGRRLATLRGDGTSTYFGWDRDSMVEEVDSTGGSARYVRHDDGYTALLARHGDAGWQLVATDAVSTPWLYLAADGTISAIDLDPLGNDTQVEGRPAPLRFAGQRADAETGLRYHRHRYYSPELGTFLTPDPLGIHGSLHDVGFVPNATEYLDPLGLIIILGYLGDDDNNESRDAADARAAATGQTVVRADQLVGAHNPGGVSLAGENHIEIIGHGPPGGGFVTFQNGTKNWMNGQQLGQALTGAGLETGAEVVVVACNAAMTPTEKPRQSVIAGVNQATGNPTAGPSGITYVRPFDPDTGTGGTVDLTDGHWEQATGPSGGPPVQTRVDTPSTQYADTWNEP